MNDLTNTEELLVTIDKSQNRSIATWIIAIIVYTTVWVISFYFLNNNDSTSVIIFLIIPLAVMLGMLKLNLKTIQKEVKLVNYIIRERYFENFIKTKQKGTSSLDKFVSIAKEVFPQVNIAITDDSTNIVKTKSGLEIITSKNVIGGIARKLIIEEISDTLTIKKLKNIKQQSVSDQIFRYIVICWDLEECINSKEFEKTMKNSLNVDIFSYKDEFLSIEWIS
jgi:hypothetical protein